MKKKTRKKVKIKARKTEKTNKRIWLVIVLLAVIAIVLLATILIFIYSNNKTFELSDKQKDNIEFQVKKPLLSSTYATTYLPAVDDKGNGVLTLLVVESMPGSGRTLVDIDNLLFWGDTQNSIRMAKRVAQNITNVDINDYNIIYNIYANASVIGGESAGAALTIATIAALENQTLRDDVIITGTINHDGTIGPVQGILPKAKAARANNATLFLVPMLESREITYESRKHCEKFGQQEFCTTEQVPRQVNISEEANITVTEVATIQDALQYFFKE